MLLLDCCLFSNKQMTDSKNLNLFFCSFLVALLLHFSLFQVVSREATAIFNRSPGFCYGVDRTKSRPMRSCSSDPRLIMLVWVWQQRRTQQGTALSDSHYCVQSIAVPSKSSKNVMNIPETSSRMEIFLGQ